ncbi:HupE/UreJ family protein [Leptospira kmetyi]|uniref:HupE/UreJ family protein n=1 Tax=Leptospira kmetyi TaxID=408139 RepID=UPI001A9C83EF|nr:HupE/UreJ family protein [Leptospira kmetyi]
MKFILYSLTVFLINLSIFAHGMSQADKQKILDAGPWQYFELGFSHMLTGYDHLLFLFGVIFFLTRFRDVLKFITAFTAGHSITLIFATLYGVQANYFLIDAFIAITVIYKAFDNLDGFKKYFNSDSPNLLWMVFIFGLVHGFGLSTRLQQLPLRQDDFILNILAFNVGVEAGQVFALGIMIVLLSKWRKSRSFENFSKATNICLLIAGGLLLMMQLHGYSHTAFPDEFPLNKDDHHHAHEDMQESNKPSALEGYRKRFYIDDKADTQNGTTHTH